MEKLEETLPIQKEGMRVIDLPVRLLGALSRGELEPFTLIEHGITEMFVLYRNLLSHLGVQNPEDEALQVLKHFQKEGVPRGLRKMGETLFEAVRNHPRSKEVIEAIANSISDFFRLWTIFAVTGNKGLSLLQRFEATYRFTRDPKIAVQGKEWDSLRSYFIEGFEKGLQGLQEMIFEPRSRHREAATKSSARDLFFFPLHLMQRSVGYLLGGVK